MFHLPEGIHQVIDQNGIAWHDLNALVIDEYGL